VNVGSDASDARNNTPLIRDERDMRRPNALNRGTNFPRHGTIDDYLSRLATTRAATNRVCSVHATLAAKTSQATPTAQPAKVTPFAGGNAAQIRKSAAGEFRQ
jgi:hypothetical protein